MSPPAAGRPRARWARRTRRTRHAYHARHTRRTRRTPRPPPTSRVCHARRDCYTHHVPISEPIFFLFRLVYSQFPYLQRASTKKNLANWKVPIFRYFVTQTGWRHCEWDTLLTFTMQVKHTKTNKLKSTNYQPMRKMNEKITCVWTQHALFRLLPSVKRQKSN
jgi:hypothetical protein